MHLRQPLRLYLIVCLTTCFTLGLFIFTSPVLADRLESNSYVINFGNFNMTSGEKGSASYNVTDTVGQTAAGLFGSLGGSTYVVGSGFQYIYPLESFQFAISKQDINLGELTVNAHNTDTHTLYVNSPGAFGYQVYAYELHTLQTLGGTNSIADTTCDSGTCSESAAGVWTNTSVPGFGFNVTGHDVATDFATANHFRQFANRATSEPMQIIMTRSLFGLDRIATVTYKAGIPGNQAAGTYQTAVAYVAVPSY